MKKLLILFLISFSPLIYAQSVTKLNANNSCANVLLLSDSAITINAPENKGNLWLKFKAEVSPMKLEILNDKNKTCNYLVFEYTDSTFCDRVLMKKLTPLRNNIANHNLVTDSPYEFLSLELVNDGINNLPENSFNIPLKVNVGQYYYVVIYDTTKTIKFNSTNKKATTNDDLVSNEFIPAYKIGDTIIIRCFTSAKNEAEFKDINCDELNHLAKYLKKNSEIKVKITSYCDTIMFWKKDPAYQKPIPFIDEKRANLTAEYMKKLGVVNLLFPSFIYIYNYNELNETLPQKGWVEWQLKHQRKWQEDLFISNKQNPRIEIILKSKDDIGYK
jgi:hypothetical protein